MRTLDPSERAQLRSLLSNMDIEDVCTVISSMFGQSVGVLKENTASAFPHPSCPEREDGC